MNSGVVQSLSSDGDLVALGSWGTSAGVLQFGHDIIIEARVSRGYMIGLSETDEFIIFRAVSPAYVGNRIDLSNQHEDFLAELTTDTWQSTLYYDQHFHDYKFRPVEGLFKGRWLLIADGRLSGSDIWEYSPSTGALKIGYIKDWLL